MTVPERTDIFHQVPMGLVDPMYDLTQRCQADTSTQKIDLGAGVYRGEDSSKPFVLSAIEKADKILADWSLGHEYGNTIGSPSFRSNAAKLIFGFKSSALQAGRIATIQTASGTSANHIGAVFAKKFLPSPQSSQHTVYIGTPAWGNYKPLFEHAGFRVLEYRYYDEATRSVDFANVLRMLGSAPARSLIVLQGCCHNPTGMDLTREQCKAVAALMMERQLFPFFDVAYQGLGDGMEEDAWTTRYFVESGFEMIVCQSFSKHMGLYGERVGALHIVTTCPDTVARCVDQLRCLVRWTYSTSPVYGARLATIVMESEKLAFDWHTEVRVMLERLMRNRVQLHRLLSEEYSTPGNWDHMLREKGLFHYSGLTAHETKILASENHIYLPSNGRVNIAGLNKASIPVVAAAIDSVVRRRCSNTCHTSHETE